MSARERVIAFLLVLAVVAPGEPAMPCTCVQATGPLQGQYDLSDAVFVGMVVEIRATEFSPAASATEYILGVEAILKIRQVWKGVDLSATTVAVQSDVGICGYFFQFGETYLVWANRRDGKLYAYLCSRTKPLDTAVDDLSWLRQSVKPSK